MKLIKETHSVPDVFLSSKRRKISTSIQHKVKNTVRFKCETLPRKYQKGLDRDCS